MHWKRFYYSNAYNYLLKSYVKFFINSIDYIYSDTTNNTKSTVTISAHSFFGLNCGFQSDVNMNLGSYNSNQYKHV